MAISRYSLFSVAVVGTSSELSVLSDDGLVDLQDLISVLKEQRKTGNRLAAWRVGELGTSGTIKWLRLFTYPVVTHLLAGSLISWRSFTKQLALTDTRSFRPNIEKGGELYKGSTSGGHR